MADSPVVAADTVDRSTGTAGSPVNDAASRGGWLGRIRNGFFSSKSWFGDGSTTEQAATSQRRWERNLSRSARVLAVMLFALFLYLLWQTIRIGADNTSYQRVLAQITTFETSLAKLDAARRLADAQESRLSNSPAATGENGATLEEAKRAHAYAEQDYRAEEQRYYLAVCQSGQNLADVGHLMNFFMPKAGRVQCPDNYVAMLSDPANGEIKPMVQAQAVRNLLDHYVLVATSYLLPILFGMMGALVFALRDMVKRPQNMEKLPKVTGYLLRVLLGAILGLIIGYVNIGGVPAGSANGIAASPLLLSLVAGFATDAVLTLLDRLAFAISYEGDRRLDETREEAERRTHGRKDTSHGHLAPAPVPSSAQQDPGQTPPAQTAGNPGTVVEVQVPPQTTASPQPATQDGRAKGTEGGGVRTPEAAE